MTAALIASASQATARPGRRHRRRGGLPWPEARLLAAQAPPQQPLLVPLVAALGRVLATDLTALGNIPAADNSAMDGWAVAGTPPWRVVADLRAGRVHAGSLQPGECVRIATGAALPAGTAAVLAVEDSFHDQLGVRPVEPDSESRGEHVRRRGEEAVPGDLLLPAGSVITPPVLGLAAAAGHDRLRVVPPAVVDVLVLGDELLDTGLAGGGRTRDALGPQLPGWLSGFGAAPRTVRRLPDDLKGLTEAIAGSDARVLVTTGGSGCGNGDHVHEAIARLGGRLVVDGVDVKPGHPMLLAALHDERWLVGLPGNPFAACAALVTLAEPLLSALHGYPGRAPRHVRLGSDSPSRPGDGHRLLPVLYRQSGVVEVQPSCGSAMLRGLAAASGLAVVGPDGAEQGDEVPYLALPWASDPGA